MAIDLDELLRQIQNHCTADQVKDLLRTGTGNKDVKLSAPSKEELIEKNLRAALLAESISIDKAYGLLREAEENGPQHIFYLRCPAKDLSSAMNSEIFDHLIASQPKSLRTYPHLTLKRGAYVTADVRRFGARKPADWMVKIYGLEVRERPTGEVIEEADRILRVFIRQEFRHVLMARWNAPDLLEIRVPRDTSITRIEAWKKQVENVLRPFVPLDRLRLFDLTKVCHALFDGQEENKNLYELGDTQVEDPEKNTITFETYAPDAGLFRGQAAREAMADLLKNSSKYRHLRVVWRDQPKSGIDSAISTLIGARLPNELIIAGHQTSRAVDHVTDQLRSFSRR